MDGRPPDRGPDAANNTTIGPATVSGTTERHTATPRRKYSEVAKTKKSSTTSKKQEEQLQIQPVPTETDPQTLSGDVEMVERPSIEELYKVMNEYLQLEAKFQPRLNLPSEPENGEITCSERDGAVQVMRCLKIWYDLPSDVLFHSINLLDRFLTKMKVRSSHLPCITVSCMNMAIDAAHITKRPPVQELVRISQSACSCGDVMRMSKVIEEKLSLAGGEKCITSLDWLRVLVPLPPVGDLQLQESKLVNQLEILACDAACANIRAPELALLLLCHHLEDKMRCDEMALYQFNEFAHNLMTVCRMESTRLCWGRTLCTTRLSNYERGAGEVAARRQHLRWRLSARTMRHLRPAPARRLPTIHDEN